MLKKFFGQKSFKGIDTRRKEVNFTLGKMALHLFEKIGEILVKIGDWGEFH